jgi:two-component system chemotaxis response regulator CheB
MLVDDSAIIRGLYRRMMLEDDGVEVVADAGNGEIAVRRLIDNPQVEVIILDIEMPVMDGVTAIPLLLKARPDVMILMSSTLTTQNANASLRAMRAGAAEYLQNLFPWEINRKLKPRAGVNNRRAVPSSANTEDINPGSLP